MTHFTEKQRFTQLWVWALILGPAAIFWYGAFHQLVRGEPLGNHPAADATLFLGWALAAVGLPLLFAFANLRTEVRDDGIAIRFLPSTAASVSGHGTRSPASSPASTARSGNSVAGASGSGPRAGPTTSAEISASSSPSSPDTGS
jgi:hypothetical protein